MLPRATDQALWLLSANGDKGFFVMIEGSHIDNGGHDNNAETVLSEIRDFDAAVKIALDFADRTPGTLVIITGDHETGLRMKTNSTWVSSNRAIKTEPPSNFRPKDTRRA